MLKADRPHPGLSDWLAGLNRLVAEQAARGVTATPATVRDSMATMTRNLVTRSPALPWVGDASVAVDGEPVPVRLYDPAPENHKPVCLFFHGGGHMAGSVAVYDPICRKLAEASGQLVVSVDYRLAPEHPYPRGLRDCLGVARHLWALLDAEGRRVERRLSLVGDSGGGTLAATVSALAQDDPALMVDKQVLIYPSLDYDLAYPSVEENGHGYLLETPRIRWYFDHYFQDGDAPDRQRRHDASPLHMTVSPRLPATLVITAGFCPLRDEAQAYVERLDAAGVPVRHVPFPDMIHAYLNLEDLVPEACLETYRVVGEFLAR
ncbi:alpha/beta hydrolase [Alloalcanivorax sp. C16-2]|uniref:alpha/beta hydrolase n=1 Tax=Alloalcanivorax sp. C16-2 TaxID=3390052 RepID=UPI00397082A2